MIELKRQVLKINNEQYLVICNKNIDREFYIAIAVAPPNDLKLMEVQESDNGVLQARFYDGEDQEKIIQESWQEIMASVQELQATVK
jgi:hypothetical protein